jgi:hypothetical protein
MEIIKKAEELGQLVKVVKRISVKINQKIIENDKMLKKCMKTKNKQYKVCKKSDQTLKTK